MTRLEKNSSALNRVGLVLALFGGLILGVSGYAHAQVPFGDFSEDAFLTGYYLTSNTAATDDVITLINGNGEIAGENLVIGQGSPEEYVPICAAVYIFDPNQEIQGCCHVTVTAGGVDRIPVNELVAGVEGVLALNNGVTPTGEIKVVALNETASMKPFGPGGSNGCSAANPDNQALLIGRNDGAGSGPPGTTFGTEDSFHGYITHTHTGLTGLSSSTFTTEVRLTKTMEFALDAGSVTETDAPGLATQCADVGESGDCCSLPGMVTKPGVGQNCIEDGE